jgi:hypothetical protein
VFRGARTVLRHQPDHCRVLVEPAGQVPARHPLADGERHLPARLDPLSQQVGAAARLRLEALLADTDLRPHRLAAPAHVRRGLWQARRPLTGP